MNRITFRSTLRVLCGALFLAIGCFHFYGYKLMAVFVPLPFGAEIFVLLVGSIICIASIGIIANRFFRTCMLTTGITLALTALLIEIPVMMREPDELIRILGLSNMAKLGLACAIFMALALVQKK